MISAHAHTAVLVEIARLYYEHNLSQQQISARMGISRPVISRLLSLARQRGIVQIRIFDPAENGTVLEQKIKHKFSLKHVIIVPAESGSAAETKQKLGKAAAGYIESLLQPGLTIGFSWGSTLLEISRSFKSHKTENITVVQLNGGVSRAEYNTHASEVTQMIGEKLRATPYLLPLPAIVDSAELKSAITSDKNISRTFDLARKSEIAVFTIGKFDQQSVLYKADYFTSNEINTLIEQGAVADICSRIITTTGQICSARLDNRTIGINLNELKSKPYSIAVAGGTEKFPAIQAALKGKYFNVLITDEVVAQKLLEENGN